MSFKDEGIKDEDKEDQDIYSDEGNEQGIDDDALDSVEVGFMKGYNGSYKEKEDVDVENEVENEVKV